MTTDKSSDSIPFPLSGGATGHALDGVTVLDLSRVLAGPWSSQILGDLGADVLKVEAPIKGDDTRLWGPPFLDRFQGDPENIGRESAYYLCVNRNKRSIGIDMAKPEGAAIIRKLAAKADIIVENFKVGGLEKYGLDYQSIKAINPRAVYCSITGFGQYGPYASRGGYDFVAQAMGGLMSVTGPTEGAAGHGPLKAGVAICDLFTGMYATVAILAALRHAERTGEGQQIDICLLDTQIAMLSNQAQSYLTDGIVGRPLGNAHPTIVPYRTFSAADGDLVVAVGNDSQFASLCKVLGRPDMAEDRRFTTNDQRVIHRPGLEETLAQLIRQRKVDELITALAARGVPCGPINTIDKVFKDPHVAARKMVHTYVREDGVEVPVTCFPPKLSATPADYRREPPRVGQHTDELLRDMLALSAEEVTKLKQSGVVS